MPKNRHNYIAAAGVFFTSLIVYIVTLYPNVPGGDSGELINAAYSLSVAHPPGYPLFTMLGKLFSFIPIGSIAWRVNLLSAVCSALASCFIYLSLFKLTKSRTAGLLAAGLFSFSPLIWEYSVGAEVFALNHLLISAFIYLLVCYEEAANKKYIYAAALIAGLGACNQHSMALFIVPAGAWWLWKNRDVFLKPKEILKILGAALLGLTPYIYVPIASSLSKSFSWGDQSSLSGLIDHFLRREYGTFSLAIKDKSTLSAVEVFIEYITHLPGQMLYVFFLLVLFGVHNVWKARKQETVMYSLVLSLFFYFIIFFNIAKIPKDSLFLQGVFERFFQQPNLLFFILAGWGASKAFEKYRIDEKKQYILVGLAILIQLVTVFPQRNHRNDTGLYDYAKGILESLPPNAIYVSQGDHTTFPLLYAHYSDNIRPDVQLVAFSTIEKDWAKKMYANIYPELKLHKNFEVFLKLNSNKAVFTRDYEIRKKYPELADDYDLIPYGVGLYLSPKGRQDFSEIYKKAIAVLPPSPGRPLSALHSDRSSWLYQAKLVHWESRFQTARYLAIQGRTAEGGEKAIYLDKAIEILENFKAHYPEELPHGVFLYLGDAYLRSQSRVPGAREKMLDSFKLYLATAPPSDPNYKTIDDLVKSQNP